MGFTRFTDFLLRAFWVLSYALLIRVFILAKRLEKPRKKDTSVDAPTQGKRSQNCS